MKNITILGVFLLFAIRSFCGDFGGKVIDKRYNAAVVHVSVYLMKEGKIYATSRTNAFGSFYFQSISNGKYKLKINSKRHKELIVKINITDEPQKEKHFYLGLTKAEKEKERAILDVDVTEDEEKVEINDNYNEMGIMGSPSMMTIPLVEKSQDFNTEEYQYFRDNSFKEVRLDPLSTFSIDVDAASYSNIRRFIQKGTKPPKDAVRVEEMINYFEYNYPQPMKQHPFQVYAEQATCPWNEKHQLVHVGVQGKKVEVEEMPANNLVFLIDVSGSMSSSNKLGLVKKSLGLLVDQMREKDRLAIVVYAGAAGVVLSPTSGANKSQIKSTLDRLNAGGSTAGGAGIQLAYKLAEQYFSNKANNRVILCTDGDFNIGTSSTGELTRMIEAKRASGIYLTVLGFGMGNYKDSRMESLADHGNGNYGYIDNILEAKKMLITEMGGTLLTIAKDVKVQVEFNPMYVKAYRLIGYENRMLNKEDFNNDKIDAGELGAGHTVTALYEIIPRQRSLENELKVDTLKYQVDKGEEVNESLLLDELLTVKFRYKLPKEQTSIKFDHVLKYEEKKWGDASPNFRFSASVAGFGMLLRDSDYKGNLTYSTVIKMAKDAKGKDQHGYRTEFIKLVEMANLY